MRAARPVFGALYNVCETRTLAAGDRRPRAGAQFLRGQFQAGAHPAARPTYGYYTGADGFYTGYYETEVVGSRVKTDEFNVPLYRRAGKTFGQEEQGVRAIRPHRDRGRRARRQELEICWVKNPVDAFFAQIQGSTRVKLDDGEMLRLNYIASNGQPYTPVGRLLIDRGIVTPEEMSMDKIRDWMEANPDEGKELRRKNRSFVFFRETALGPHDECIGAQGIPLTPGRSLAVDPKIHVYGTPIWIDAKLPIKGDEPQDTFQHLMVAQDTGSAIIGAARADIYFGHGEELRTSPAASSSSANSSCWCREALR